MKTKNFILSCIVAVLFISCIGNKQKPSENASSIQQKEKQSELNVPVTVEQMKDFLYENDDSIKRNNREITFIKKANLGIPGGDNWIVRFNDLFMFIYLIDGNKIISQYDFWSYNMEDYSTFNIMQGIPGTHIGNSTSSIYDFNGDGVEELFSYRFGGRGYFISIIGYGEGRERFVPYCEIPFEILDSEQGPAPVEFLTYNGIYGFKVYFFQFNVAGGPEYIPGESDYQHPNNRKWIFYTWDAEQRKYVEVGEVVE